MPEYRVKRSKFNENLPEIIELFADAVAGANFATRRRILDCATAGQRLLCGYYFYWDDVTNGGHWQYFGNYTGNFWQEALEATKVLRLPEEKILRDAVALFPNTRCHFPWHACCAETCLTRTRGSMSWRPSTRR